MSDRVCEDLKGAIAQWIASSGRPTAIVDDPGLKTVLRVALQNQQYTLPSRRTIDNIIAQCTDVWREAARVSKHCGQLYKSGTHYRLLDVQ